jgi:hypothetical protein
LVNFNIVDKLYGKLFYSQINKNMDTERTKAIRFIKIMLFSASIIPTLVAGAMAYNHQHTLNINYFLLLIFALFIGQAGGDYLYYYFTNFHSDSRDSHTKIFAGWHPLFVGKMLQPKNTVYAGFFCLAIDLIIGIYFAFQLGYIIIVLAIIGGLIAIFFTPLMLKGYKEPVIFVTFGPLCLVGVYYVLTGNFSVIPLIVSLPIGFLVTVVAYLKGAHFEVKEEGDSEVILKLSKKPIIVMSILAYISLIIAVIFKFLPPLSILSVVASLPISFSILFAISKQSSQVSNYLWAVVRALLALIIGGLLIAVGILF